MTMEEDLARLVRETVKVEVENHMRTRSSELIGRGGDVVLGGMGNIYLQPGVNKKAYYKGTEIGTGTGGGVTDHGALTGLADDDHTQYLLATGARPITGDQSIYSEKAFKFYEDAGSVLDGKIYADLDVENARHFYIWASASTYIDLYPATGYIIVQAGSDVILSGGTGSNLIWAYNNIKMLSGYNIDVNSNKVINLAAATTNGDAVRYEQALLNPLTSDLTIKEASPMLYFQDVSANPLGSIGSLGAGFYIKNDVASGSIYIQTGAGAGVTRIQVYDTGVALGVPLVMGSNAITTNSTVDGVDVSTIPSTYLPLAGGTMTGAIAHGAYDASFADGYGIDFRNDNVHKLSYASGSNSLQISTYDVCNFYFTRDSSTRLSVDYDGVRFGHAAFFRKNHADDLTYIVDDATGSMEFHVGTGDKFKFVIG
jgi:hypothetical protein